MLLSGCGSISDHFYVSSYMWNVDVHEDIHTNKNLTFLKNCVELSFLVYYSLIIMWALEFSLRIYVITILQIKAKLIQRRIWVAEKFTNFLYVLFAKLVGIWFPKVPLCWLIRQTLKRVFLRGLPLCGDSQKTVRFFFELKKNSIT